MKRPSVRVNKLLSPNVTFVRGMCVGIVAPSFIKSRFSSSVSTSSLNWNWRQKRQRCLITWWFCACSVTHKIVQFSCSMYKQRICTPFTSTDVRHSTLKLSFSKKKNRKGKNWPGLSCWVQMDPVLSPLWPKCRAPHWWCPPPPYHPFHHLPSCLRWQKYSQIKSSVIKHPSYKMCILFMGFEVIKLEMRGLSG